MKPLYAFAFSVLFCAALQAQNVYLAEQFDYPANAPLTDHGWFSHSKAGTNSIQTTDGGLSLDLTPYSGSGIGNAAAVSNTGSNENTPFNTYAESGSVYLSFLIEVPDEVTEENAGFFLHLGEYDNVDSPVFTSISSAFRARTFVAPGSTSDHFRLGLNFNAAAVPSDSANLSNDLNLNETYLVVVKYEIIEGPGNDLVSLYVFADGDDASTEPAEAAIGPFGGSARDLEAVQLVALRQYDSDQNIIVDGIIAQDVWDMEPELTAPDCPELEADFGDACDADGAPGEINESCECEATQASTLLTEQFDYPAGALIRDFGWFPHSAANTNPIQVNDFGLSWSQTAYLGSGVGNAASVSSSGSNENRPLNESVTEGSVYVSFLMEVPEEVDENNSGFFFHLGEYSNVDSPVFTSISNAFRARTFVAPGTASDKYRLGLNFNAAAVPTDAANLSNELNLNETYLVVVKYEIVPGSGNDLVSLYVFEDGDDITSEPETPNIGPFGGTARDLEAVQLVALRQYSADQNIIVDGIVARDVWLMEEEEQTFDCEALEADFGDACDADGLPGEVNENCECEALPLVTFLEEQFDYPSGELIRDFGWFPHSSDTINPIAVAAEGLSWNQTSYAGSGIGKAAAVNNNGSNENRPLSDGVSSGAVYVSFLMNTPEVDASNAGFFFHLGEYSDVDNPDFNSIASAFRARTFTAPGSTPDKFRLGLNFNAAAVPTNENNLTDELDAGETYLVVVKYQIIDGPGNDLVSLYVFADGDDISTEPAAADIGPIGGTARDLEEVQLVALRQYSETQNITVDGIIARNGWDLEGEPLPECLANGGTLTALSPVSLCTGSGEPQGVNIQLTGAVGEFGRFGLLDTDNNVLEVRAGNANFNLDVYPPGQYRIRHLRYESDVNAAELASLTNASQLANVEGCWASSNTVNVFLSTEPEGGTLTATSPTIVCAASGSQTVITTELTGATGFGSRFFLVNSSLPGNPVVANNSSGAFNLNAFSPGTYQVRHLSYQQGVSLTDIETAADLKGCFDISNGVNVSIVNCGATISSSPNPTSAQSYVTFTNPRDEYATLEVYDMSGRMIARIFQQVTAADHAYRIEFDGAHLPNGVYLYRLTTASETITEKFMISR